MLGILSHHQLIPEPDLSIPAFALDLPQPLTQIQQACQVRHYSLRTDRSYQNWVRRYVQFHHNQHPAALGQPELEKYLTHLAMHGRVASATQNQALAAILFLYRDVLRLEPPWVEQVVRDKPSKRVPVVLARSETPGRPAPRLLAALLYSSGMRKLEVIRLRIKDIDFERRQIIVRDAKGAKDRFTVLSDALVPTLHNQIEQVKLAHDKALQNGYGGVHLPRALERKIPGAARQFIWQYLFPADTPTLCPRTGICRHHHIHDVVLS